ncbi:CPBP family intramembrane glutamic endopeptidase [Anaerocolumna sp. MB42-C2]|uniref:CPBP family intramembrane glutamic endopeptidase n=1 Tax=Anaerocolumna sp. MB42-C2 TaxID=3070997 RepID=UPI0027DEF9B7|nr:CPBP family intramembrane glutamic endopeptidase [Anaerocolumna sp. MB42-C2]WMJ89025.1 CPBP family intramembrane glutamic endopeptidase [Anaerocolumna sp. MB42-C2]
MTDNKIKQLSVPKLLLLVFIPAILIFGTYFWATQFEAVIPPFLSFTVIILIILIPSEIGIILFFSKRETNHLNLLSAFIKHEKMPVYKIIGISAVLILIGGIVFTFVSPIERNIMFHTIYQNVPEYFKLSDFFIHYKDYPRCIIIISFILYAVSNGILGPIAEELYFRGFLMPRINRFGNWTPVIITVLFSAYHLFSPWEFLTRIIACLPFVYCVYKKKNIYIGMIVHCTLNTASVIMAVLSLLK